MQNRKIGVGIVAVTPGRSWATLSHIPALRSLPGYELVAVANSNADSSRKAAEACDIPKSFPNAAALAADPAVDFVAVTVKVPHHKELVDAALDNKKMVYCEWPLGNGLAEAEAMAARAEELGVSTAVGLQARSSPTVRYVRDLIRDGFLGQALSTTLIGSGGDPGAGELTEANAYLNDRANGATMLTIPFGHTIDALCWCLGEFREVWATVAMRRKAFIVKETNEIRPMAADDQLIVGGVLENDVVVSAHYRAGISRGTNLLWEINGTEGDLQITGPLGHVQMTELTLRGGRGDQIGLSVLEIPAKYRTVPLSVDASAVPVAEAYVRFEEGIGAVDQIPDFDAGVRRHKLLDAIERSAATGERIKL